MNRLLKCLLTRAILVLVVPTAVVTGCGGGIELAPKAKVTPGNWIPVRSLPPPAVPEEIRPLPEGFKGLVWTDGCWEWSVGRWVWVRGGWVDMPQGGAYFPGRIVVGRGGELTWFPCTWLTGNTVLGTIAPTVPALYPSSARSVAQQ
jgi:hypothetical protein